MDFLDVEWKLIFVASPDHLELDQELDDCLVGPIPVGINSFEFDANPPDPTKIPDQDIIGVAAIILTGSYRDQEFVRVGYYQNTEYDNEEMKETPPQKPLYDRLIRELADKPRVTRFNIRWYEPSPTLKRSSTEFFCRDNGMSANVNMNGPIATMPGAALPRDYSGQGQSDSAFVPNANDSMALG